MEFLEENITLIVLGVGKKVLVHIAKKVRGAWISTVVIGKNMYKEVQNNEIDHKILAKHFNKTNEAMRLLKRKYEKSKTGLWIVYVKAYSFDMLITPTINSKPQTPLTMANGINHNTKGLKTALREGK